MRFITLKNSLSIIKLNQHRIDSIWIFVIGLSLGVGLGGAFLVALIHFFQYFAKIAETYVVREYFIFLIYSGILQIIITLLLMYVCRIIALARLLQYFYIFLGLIFGGLYLYPILPIGYYALVLVYPLVHLMLFYNNALLNSMKGNINISKLNPDLITYGVHTGQLLIAIWLLYHYQAFVNGSLPGIYIIVGAGFIIASVLLWAFTSRHPAFKYVQEDVKEIYEKHSFYKFFETNYLQLLSLLSILYVILLIYIDFEVFITLISQEKGIINPHDLVYYLLVYYAILQVVLIFTKRVAFIFLIQSFNALWALQSFVVLTFVFLLFAFVFQFLNFDDQTDKAILLLLLFTLFNVLIHAFYRACAVPIFRRFLLVKELNLRLDTQIKLEGVFVGLGFLIGAEILLIVENLQSNLEGAHWFHFLALALISVLAFYVGQIVYGDYKQSLQNKYSAEKRTFALRKLVRPKYKEEVIGRLARHYLNKIHKIPGALLKVNLNVLNLLSPILVREAVLRLLDEYQSMDGYLHTLLTTKQNHLHKHYQQLVEKYPKIKDKKIDTLFSSKELYDLSLFNLVVALRQWAEEKIRSQNSEEDQAMKTELKNFGIACHVVWVNFESSLQRIGLSAFKDFKEFSHKDASDFIHPDTIPIKNHWKLRILIFEFISNLDYHYQYLIVQNPEFKNADLDYIFSSQKLPPQTIRNLVNSLSHWAEALAGEQIGEAKQKSYDYLQNFAQACKEEWVNFESRLKRIDLRIDDEVQVLSLQEAQNVCLLEAIPLLECLTYTKYFQALRNRNLIGETLDVLCKAESRLNKDKTKKSPHETSVYHTKNVYVRQLTESQILEERLFGAYLSAYIDENDQAEIFENLYANLDAQSDIHIIPEIKFRTIIALSYLYSRNAYFQLVPLLEDIVYGNVALDSLIHIGEAKPQILLTLQEELQYEELSEKTKLRILQFYASQLNINVHTNPGQTSQNTSDNALLFLKSQLSFLNLESVLSYQNQKIDNFLFNIFYQYRLQTRLQLNDREEKRLYSKLRMECGALVWKFSVIKMLDKKRQAKQVTTINVWKNARYTEPLVEAFVEEIDKSYDTIFKTLSFVYHKVKDQIIEIKQNLFSSDVSRIEYAKDLLDVLLQDFHKPLLLPIFDAIQVNTYELDVSLLESEDLKDYYSIQYENTIDLLEDIITSEFSRCNVWTKACALFTLIQLPLEDWTEETRSMILAHLNSPQVLLSELSHYSLQKQLHQNAYYEHFVQSAANFKDFEEIKAQIEHRRDFIHDMEDYNDIRLKFNIIQFLKKEVKEFAHIKKGILTEFAEIIELKQYQADEEIYRGTNLLNANLYIVRSGNLSLESEGAILQRFTVSDFLHNFEFIQLNSIAEKFKEVKTLANGENTYYETSYTLKAKKGAIILHIDRYKFNELLSLYEELSLGFLKYYEEVYSLAKQLQKIKEFNAVDSLLISELSSLNPIPFEGKFTPQTIQELGYPFIKQGRINLEIQEKGNHKLKACDWEKGQIIPTDLFHSDQTRDSLSTLNKQLLINRIELGKRSSVVFYPWNKIKILNDSLIKTRVLKSLAEFEKLPSTILFKIADIAHVWKVQKGQYFASFPDLQSMDCFVLNYFENERGKFQSNGVYGEQKRLVQLSYKINRELIFEEYEHLACIQALRFANPSIYDIKIKALTDTQIMVIKKEDFNDVVSQFPQISLSILAYYRSDSLYRSVKFLRSLSIFESVDIQAYIDLAQNAEIRNFAEGERIATYLPNQKMDVFFVERGRMRINMDPKLEFTAADSTLSRALNIPQTHLKRIYAIDNCILHIIGFEIFEKINQKYKLIPLSDSENPEVLTNKFFNL